MSEIRKEMTSEVNYYKDLYQSKIRPQLQKELGMSNIYQVPKLKSIILSMGFNKRTDKDKNIEYLTTIALQKPLITKAKKSVAQFGVREGMIGGAKVTLRGNNMYMFLGQIMIALLSKRDWKGLSIKSINNTKKNLSISFGITDVRLFADVKSDSLRSEGLNVTFVTSCTKSEHVVALLKAFDIPLRS